MSHKLNVDNQAMNDHDADFELRDDGHTVPLAKSTEPRKFQPSVGRPIGYSPDKARKVQERLENGEDVDEDDPTSEGGRLATSVKKAIAQARKETALAGLNELELKVKSGQYLPRAAFREAAATLLAALSQGLRSLPDALERKFSLEPDVLQVIELAIDDSLSTVAESLALFTDGDA